MLKKLLVNFVFLLVGAMVVTAIASSFVYFSNATTGFNAASKIGSIIGSSGQPRCVGFSSAEYIAITSRHCMSDTDRNIFTSRDLAIKFEFSSEAINKEYQYNEDIVFAVRKPLNKRLVPTCKEQSHDVFYYQKQDPSIQSSILVKYTTDGLTFFDKLPLNKGDSGTPIFSNKKKPCLLGVYSGWVEIDGDEYDYFVNLVDLANK